MLTSPALLSMVSSRSASTRAISTRSTGAASRPGNIGALAHFQRPGHLRSPRQVRAGAPALPRAGSVRMRARLPTRMSALGAAAAEVPAGAGTADALAAAAITVVAGALLPVEIPADSPGPRICAISSRALLGSVPALTRSRMRESSSRLACMTEMRVVVAHYAPLSICSTKVSSSWLRSPMAEMPAMRAPPLSVCS